MSAHAEYRLRVVQVPLGIHRLEVGVDRQGHTCISLMTVWLLGPESTPCRLTLSIVNAPGNLRVVMPLTNTVLKRSTVSCLPKGKFRRECRYVDARRRRPRAPHGRSFGRRDLVDPGQPCLSRVCPARA